MRDPQTIRDLFQHMQWADRKVWRVVLESSVACEDAKLRACLYHIHLVQHAYLRMWRKESFDLPFPQFATTVEVYDWSRDYYPEAIAFLDSLSAEDLARTCEHPWTEIITRQIGQAPETVTLGETAHQVVLHSTYHRGQANAQLRALGAEPPTVEYITWLWLGRETTEQTEYSEHTE